MNWRYNPLEDPDWGYARNLQTVLKTVGGTWSQSIFSENHHGLLAPTRDYPYQGLTAMMGRESWKFLDAIYFSAFDGRQLPLRAWKVLVTPWKSVYRYRGGANIDVSYYLFEDPHDGVSAKVEFSSDRQIDLTVKPLVDIRVMPGYEERPPSRGDWRSEALKNSLLVSSQGKSLLLHMKGEPQAYKSPLMYKYKLGSGWRTETSNGVEFIEEYYAPVFAGELRAKGRKFKLLISCDEDGMIGERMERTKRMREWKHALPKLGYTLGDRKADKALRARLYCLRNFDLLVGNSLAPAAGDYWFKQVYFRDTFEGLYNNFNVLFDSRGGKEYVKKVLMLALSTQDKLTGRIPNIYSKSMDAADATFLCYMVAGEYLKREKDKELARKALKAMELTVKSMEKAKPFVNGPCVLREDGLVLSVPWHSWVDSRRTVHIDGNDVQLVPTRVPRNWLNEIYAETGNPRSVYYETNKSDYLLPDLNAQWLRTLEAGMLVSSLLGKKGKFSMLYEKAGNSYLEALWDGDFPYNIIRGEKRDSTRTSMGLVSMVLLESRLFGKSEFKGVWPIVNKMLVYRKGKPFGIVVKDSERTPYLDENEYHEAVSWPRDVPYLVKYFLLSGKRKMAKDLLLNHLDHQMSEGAIFYSHELFSLAKGKNPYNKGSGEPVPVKNPIQYWSQFVEPFEWAFK